MKRLLLLLALMTAWSIKAEVTLIERGTPKMTIVVAPDAPKTVVYAAEELQTHLKLRTGAEVKIVNAGASIVPGTIPFYLGAAAPNLDVSQLKPDGFLLKITPQYAYIAGRDQRSIPSGLYMPFDSWWVSTPQLPFGAFGETGTLNGVYRFLEQYAGVRWYMTGDLGRIVPRHPSLQVPETSMQQAPDFPYRYAFFVKFADAPADAVWYRRVGFGAPFSASITHSFWALRDQYASTHPEYFALIGGQRDTETLSSAYHKGNLCLSNPDMFNAFVNHICDYFAKHPDEKIYPVCPNDGWSKICECPACQKQLSPQLGPDGIFSDYFWNFANRIAQATAKKYPDRMIGAIAYEKYQAPPDNIKPEDFSPNLAVMICYQRQNFRDPALLTQHRAFVRKWHNLTSNLYFWTYPLSDYWPPFRGFPMCYPHLIQDDMKENKAIGAQGEFLESEFRFIDGDQDVDTYRIAYPGLTHLNAYIRAKLLWNVNTDLGTLLTEYYREFYGPAEKPMREFWETAEKLFLAKKTDHPLKQYRADDIRNFYRLLGEALSLVPPDSVYAARIKMILNEMKPFTDKMIHFTEVRRPLMPTLTDGPIPLTENLAGDIWKKATIYTFVTKDGGTPKSRTMLLALAGRDGLGLTYLNFENHPDKLAAVRSGRDAQEAWEDDNVEAYFYDRDSKRHWQYILTAGGVLWDGIGINGEPSDSTWNGKALHKVWKTPDRWVAQLFIPWSDLGMKNRADAERLKCNFYRTRKAGEADVQYSAFTPTMVHQHLYPEFFAPIVFSQAVGSTPQK